MFVKHNAPDKGQFQRCQDRKDKFFDTNRKILSQEMTMRNMEALIPYFFISNANIKIGKISWSKG